MRLRLLLLVSLALALPAPSEVSVPASADVVTPRLWTAEDLAAGYPELVDGEYSVPWLRERPSFGVAPRIHARLGE